MEKLPVSEGRPFLDGTDGPITLGLLTGDGVVDLAPPGEGVPPIEDIPGDGVEADSIPETVNNVYNLTIIPTN